MTSKSRAERPNLIFLLPDQWGAAAMACYGNPDVQTPNLNRLAEESVVFERAYTASPVCTPYRGTLFTGRYPTQTGVTKNGYRIPHDEVTLAQAFNRGGYHTAYVGKWHLSGPPGGNRWVPPAERSGFETFVGWESHHVDHWQGRIWADDPVHPLPMPGHETDALTDIALDVLKGLEPPFCLFIAYQSPHPPCAPPVDFLQLYQDRPLHLRPNVDDSVWYDRPEWNADYDLCTFVERYYGEITHLDSAIGRVLSEITAENLADDTIVVFTSDHGESMGSHGLFGKGVMYDEALHVPLIVRYPDRLSGMRTGELFSSVDFAPTLLDLCGLPGMDTAEGISYAPLIRGESRQGCGAAIARDDVIARGAVYAEYGDQLCVRRKDLKLVVVRETLEPVELFDLTRDPYEQDNRVADPTYRALREDLLRTLTTWYQDIRERRGEAWRTASEPLPDL